MRGSGEVGQGDGGLRQDRQGRRPQKDQTGAGRGRVARADEETQREAIAATGGRGLCDSEDWGKSEDRGESEVGGESEDWGESKDGGNQIIGENLIIEGFTRGENSIMYRVYNSVLLSGF